MMEGKIDLKKWTIWCQRYPVIFSRSRRR